jgi:phage terminase large subunit-like protein
MNIAAREENRLGTNTLGKSPLLSESNNSLAPSREQRIARAKAILQATVLENPWIPETIKAGLTPNQAEFSCFEGREALYGGAAGGGKSVALLIAALQYVDEIGYSALILRRTYKQLAKADSILMKSKEWLSGTKARWNGDEKKWTFPNGSTVEFGHMEHEDSRFDYQGGAWAFVGVDEATQFTETMIAYPRSRQRRPAGSRIPIRWRGGSNPGGIGHEHIKTRYVISKQTKDRQFFPATLDDNPNIDREEYVKTLKESGIDPLTLDQLLKGDWDAVAGGRFKREWFRYYSRRGDYIGMDGYQFDWRIAFRFMTCDPAASAKNEADYTVICVWAVSPKFELVLLWCLRIQKEITEIIPSIQSVWDLWKPGYVGIEGVAANDAVFKLALKTRMIAKKLSPGGDDKLVRAIPAMVLAQTGRIWLPDQIEASRIGFPLNDIVSELCRFTGIKGKDDHDDIVDNFGYAANELSNGAAKPAGRPMVLGGNGQ